MFLILVRSIDSRGVKDKIVLVDVLSCCSEGFLLEMFIMLGFLGIMTLKDKINRQEIINHHPPPVQNHEERMGLEPFQNDEAAALDPVHNEPRDDAGVGGVEPEPAGAVNLVGLEIEDVPDLVMNNFQNDGRVDVLLGLGERGVLHGAKNMMFVTVANALFLLCFQFIPFTIGRLVNDLFWTEFNEPFIVT